MSPIEQIVHLRGGPMDGKTLPMSSPYLAMIGPDGSYAAPKGETAQDEHAEHVWWDWEAYS